MKNKVFLLLPLATSGISLDQVYLKTPALWDEKLLLHLCEKVSDTNKLNDHEAYDKIFDQRNYSEMRKLAKSLEHGNRKTPSIVNRLDAAFKNFKDFRADPQLDDTTPVDVNHVNIVHTIINAYLNIPNRDCATLVDCDAISVPHQTIAIKDAQGNEVSVSIISCTAKELYEWFVTHRMPQRKYDPNYKKHGMQNHWSQKGVNISKMTYTSAKAQEILQRAVGTKMDKKNLFFYDRSKNVMLVFWDEGLTPPQYHGYEVDYSNDIIQKIYAKGSTNFKNKIDTVAGY